MFRDSGYLGVGRGLSVAWLGLCGRSIMDDSAREFLDGLRSCFAELKDPRVVARCDHQLLDIVTITLLAVLCGAEDWPDIELFGETRKDWLGTFLELPHGIPSHDTFRRVFGALERNQLAQALFQGRVRNLVSGSWMGYFPDFLFYGD